MTTGCRTVIHVGFPKTASSYLQMHYFPLLADVHTVSYGHPSGFVDVAKGLRGEPSEADMNAVITQWRALSVPEGYAVRLLSWEGLVGHYREDFRDGARVTACLHAAFPDATILLVIRAQDSLAESLYRQTFKRGYAPSIEDFLNVQRGVFGPAVVSASPNLAVGRLSFSRYVEAYEAAFGVGRVRVVPYEWLVADPGRFFSAITGCLGVPAVVPDRFPIVNRGYSDLSVRIARPLTRAFAALPPGWQRGATSVLRGVLQGGVDRLFHTRRPLVRASIRRQILAHHEGDNRALSERFQLDLGALGYFG